MVKDKASRVRTGILSRLSRRQALRILLAGCAGFPFLSRSAASTNTKYPFEAISSSSSGIHWIHDAGRSPEKYLPESAGPGCAFLDFDGDGWLDIYLVNSGKSDFYTPSRPLRNALYRNNRDGTFTDVTEKAGVSGGGFGMGVAVGDYNNDGFPDLYVTQCGRSILYHNNGDGTFTDVTEQAGVGVVGWASSAVWFDYDNDGRLDLFVCQFAEFDKSRGCGIGADGQRHYCIPKIFRPMPSWLFHNNGDGTFTDVSRDSGIAAHLGKAWGAVATDLNNDGRLDLFVSNDTVGNFLFMNRGGGHFDEAGLSADISYSQDGRARSGMGVDAADFNQDGWMDLFVSNIDEEIFSLYQNSRDGTFDDRSMPLGVGMSTRWMSGWGVKFFDYDNDGDLDLFLANGFPDDLVGNFSSQVKYEEPFLLFHNSDGKFVDVSQQSGPAFERAFAARGLALGDFDNDGGVDVLVGVNNAAPVLLHNQVGRNNHWLGLRLVGTKANRDAIGARVSYQSGDWKRMRTIVGGGSFMSSHDPRLILGLGSRTSIDALEVQWPQPGGVERFKNLPVDRYITIVEGTGKWK
jgi:enediyne biosynthesis protein E4